MNESGTAIGFSRVSNSGVFGFPSMDYGTYFLRAELSGVTSDNMRIEITAEKPHVDVFLNFSGNSILGLDENNPAEGLLSVYPNPVDKQLNILLDLPGSSKVEIEIFTITGQRIYRTSESAYGGQNIITIPFNDFPGGMYMIWIHSEYRLSIVRKIVK